MIPIFKAEEMAALDRAAIDGLGIPGIVLMESAARGVFRTAVDILGHNYGASVPLPAGINASPCGDHCDCSPNLPPRFIAPGRSVKVFCGKGNNGGDGLAVARMLDSVGCFVEIILLCQGDEMTGDAKTNYDLAVKLEIPIIEDAEEEDFIIEGDTDLVIDALLGTGMKGAAQGKIAEAIGEINQAECPVLSIDIPSGVEGSTGMVNGPAVYANATATMAGLKRGLIFSPGREHAGEITVVDIGTPGRLVEESQPYLWQIEPNDIFGKLPIRAEDTHKGEAGRVFIMAGSPGMTGAACMSADACVKSGAGLVVLGIPESSNPVVEMKLTEAMSQPLAETDTGSLASEAEELIAQQMEWATALAIGPGLSRNSETMEFVRNLIGGMDKPVVIDADALYALAEKPDSLNKLPKDSILTPHMGEFSRLIGKSVDDIKVNRVDIVRGKAQDWKTVIILKGSPSVIACPDGNVYVNTTGNPGMASGGVGDVLTGILAALLGAGVIPEDAAVAGTFLHGLAGNMAASEKGILGMTATDMISKLHEVFKEYGC